MMQCDLPHTAIHVLDQNQNITFLIKSPDNEYKLLNWRKSSYTLATLDMDGFDDSDIDALFTDNGDKG